MPTLLILAGLWASPVAVAETRRALVVGIDTYAPPKGVRAPRGRTRWKNLLKRSGRWLDWASLLRRVFLAEVLACACGGTRRVIAQIKPGPTARKILRHLGLPDTAPELAPARLDQADFWATGPPTPPDCDAPWTDDVQRSPDDFAA